MIFTRHAIERYRQFHMLDRPTATDDDARVILDAHAAEAAKLPARTFRGDEVWTIHALGIELVVKRDMPDPVCVTVLPPARFRGLTPLQAEIVEAAASAAKERVARAQIAASRAESEKKTKKPAADKARGTGGSSVIQYDAAAERLRAAKHELTLALCERDVLTSTLKTMRMQLTAERDADPHRGALRIAVRALLDGGAAEAIQKIAAIDPGLATHAFAYGGDHQNYGTEMT